MRNRIVHIDNNKFVKENLNKLLTIFLNNGYPKNLVHQLIFKTNFLNAPTEDYNPNLNVKYKNFLKKLTEKIIRKVQGSNRNSHLQIAKCNTFTTRTLFTRVKDKIPPLFQSNVIYRIPCRDCDCCYIDKTNT